MPNQEIKLRKCSATLMQKTRNKGRNSSWNLMQNNKFIELNA